MIGYRSFRCFDLYRETSLNVHFKSEEHVENVVCVELCVSKNLLVSACPVSSYANPKVMHLTCIHKLNKVVFNPSV